MSKSVGMSKETWDIDKKYNLISFASSVSCCSFDDFSFPYSISKFPSTYTPKTPTRFSCVFSACSERMFVSSSTMLRIVSTKYKCHCHSPVCYQKSEIAEELMSWGGEVTRGWQERWAMNQMRWEVKQRQASARQEFHIFGLDGWKFEKTH